MSGMEDSLKFDKYSHIHLNYKLKLMMVRVKDLNDDLTFV